MGSNQGGVVGEDQCSAVDDELVCEVHRVRCAGRRSAEEMSEGLERCFFVRHRIGKR